MSDCNEFLPTLKGVLQPSHTAITVSLLSLLSLLSRWETSTCCWLRSLMVDDAAEGSSVSFRILLSLIGSNLNE